ncbi:MAG: hypothetical protein U0353_14615 [Sandaracinus sp.]
MPPTLVAERVGVSVDTVERVRRESAVTHVDDAAERRARAIGRPSKASPFTDEVRSWLAEDPETPTQELLRRAIAAGYSGKKSAFYALVSGRGRHGDDRSFKLRARPLFRSTTGQIDVQFVDGRRERVHFFASRLKYSRFVAVSLVQNERVETLVRSLVRHFVSFGGVPLLAVFDRPRTIVAKSGKGREVARYNETFAQTMLELGVGAEMCAPRSGNQKGAVEHLVKWVKNTFFKYRKFVDERDLETQLAAWVHEANFETKSRATNEIPETLRQRELPRLRPVKLTPETLALRVPVFVGPTAEVMFEGRAYSMPPEAVHVPGTAFVYEDRIRFVAGRFEAEHARGKAGDPPASLPEHRAAKIGAVHGRRAKLYEKREQLLHLGAPALELITALVHRDHKQGNAHVERLHDLLEAHGEAAMRRALDRIVLKKMPTRPQRSTRHGKLGGAR